ncbi:EKC/KEOPS complex subunit LAGE3 isoform X2 [Microcebus murinus]|uniref:EKC/KEOPS complex subunit LAGE3 isoform X2 n=1 Tax=Microcebus murinus TaxID=30608 RepID=UPI003F6C31C5
MREGRCFWREAQSLSSPPRGRSRRRAASDMRDTDADADADAGGVAGGIDGHGCPGGGGTATAVAVPSACLSQPLWRQKSLMGPWLQMPNPTEGRLGRILHRWKAEDSHLLRISIINFLDQLSLVVQTMQRFGPPVSR